MPFSAKKKVSLRAFVHGIIDAVNCAQEAIGEHREWFFRQHMIETSENHFEPKKVGINIDENSCVEVPTFALYKTPDLTIKTARVSGSAKIIDMEEFSNGGTVTTTPVSSLFYVRPTKKTDKNAFTLELEFDSMEKAEIEHLLEEKLNMGIETARQNGEDEKPV